MSDKHPFYLREWRKFRGLTQAKLADLTGMATGYVAELESRKRRYNEDVLETLALALGCKPVDLLIRNPQVQDSLEAVFNDLPVAQRPQAINVLKALSGKTGTNG